MVLLSALTSSRCVIIHPGQAVASRNKHLDPVPISRLLEELPNTTLGATCVPADANAALDAKQTDQPQHLDGNVGDGDESDADVVMKPGKMEVTDIQLG